MLRGAFAPLFSLTTMTILNDKAISAFAENDILMPYFGTKQRMVDNHAAISYGLSQCGYDICLSDKSFRVFNGKDFGANARPILDPKLMPTSGAEAPLNHGPEGCWYVLPAHSFGLGISMERFTMPNNVFALVEGKSTYGRCGLIANILPIEPGWSGYLTMCLINPTAFGIKLYAREGIAQVVFFDCGEVGEAYSGHYQNQGAKVRLAAV